jgi:hypothetical protein
MTAMQAVPMRFTWCASIHARLLLMSFATTPPSTCVQDPGPLWLWIISSICEVFEPGAAHMSSTRSVGFSSRNSAGSIDTTSCRVIKPQSAACCTSSCSSFSGRLFFSWYLLRFIS